LDETSQDTELQLRPPRPLDPVGSSAKSAQELIEDDDDSETVGTIALDGDVTFTEEVLA
jgi:hypothetical protein